MRAKREGVRLATQRKERPRWRERVNTRTWRGSGQDGDDGDQQTARGAWRGEDAKGACGGTTGRTLTAGKLNQQKT